MRRLTCSWLQQVQLAGFLGNYGTKSRLETGNQHKWWLEKDRAMYYTISKWYRYNQTMQFMSPHILCAYPWQRIFRLSLPDFLHASFPSHRWWYQHYGYARSWTAKGRFPDTYRQFVPKRVLWSEKTLSLRRYKIHVTWKTDLRNTEPSEDSTAEAGWTPDEEHLHSKGSRTGLIIDKIRRWLIRSTDVS